MKPVFASALIFVLWALLAFLARCHDLRTVLVDGRIYYPDGDCYSRMTRARIVDAHLGTIIHHQDFENYPTGVNSHATAPMDYAIVVTKWIVAGFLFVFDPHRTSILEAQKLDVAGALVSPLLGALACGFLALFARGLPVGGVYRWSVPFFWAVCPILVWGTILGRPDHQSLQMALLAVALAAECRLTFEQTRRWAYTACVSWALAIWVSLYEPAVLFGLVMALWVCLKPRALLSRARRPAWIVFAVILGGALALEGWQAELPQPEMRGYLLGWGGTIGELYRLDFVGPTLFGWLGASCLAAFVLLVVASLQDKRAIAGIVLLAATLALTWWQVRWGYFMALVFALTLPWQFSVIRKWPMAACVFLASLLPVWREHPLAIVLFYSFAGLMLASLFVPTPESWGGRVAILRWWIFAAVAALWVAATHNEARVTAWRVFFAIAPFFLLLFWPTARRVLQLERVAVVGALAIFFLWPMFVEWNVNLFPDDRLQEKRDRTNVENRLLRQAAEALRGPAIAPFIAPWWTSPELAYWSGQPGVAGSSHESIAGIVDSARFFLAKTPEEAAAVLRARGVSRIVTDDPDHILQSYAPILGVQPQRKCMATLLTAPSHRPAPYLIQTFDNDYFRVFAVDQARLPQ